MDDAPPDVRRASVELELAALADLGLAGAELGLRDYFGRQQRLRQDLAGVSMAWLRGGNTFMLRHALHRSGADTVLREMLAETHWSMPGIALGHASCRPACED